MLRVEMKRAFGGKMFWLALSVGTLLCVVQFVTVPLQAVQHLNFQAANGMLGGSVFNRWIGGGTGDFLQIAYFAVLPILAVLPHGDTFYRDRQSGYARQFYTRGQRTKYLRAKYAAGFLSAGVAVTAPLVLNLFLTMTALPSIIPQRATMLYALLLPREFLTELFYSDPYMYVCVYFVLDFVIAGLLAGLAMLVSYASSNRFVPLLFPFALYLFSGTLLQAVNLGGWSMMSFANPSQPNFGTHAGCVIVELFILAVASLLFFIVGRKEDVF